MVIYYCEACGVLIRFDPASKAIESFCADCKQGRLRRPRSRDSGRIDLANRPGIDVIIRAVREQVKHNGKAC